MSRHRSPLCATALGSLLLLSAAPARADDSSASAPARADEPGPTPSSEAPFGTALRSSRSAEPAMMESFIAPGLGLLYLPSTPSVRMDGGVRAPRRSELFGAMSLGNAHGGGLGLKTFYSILSFDFGLVPAGDAMSSFIDGGKTYGNGRYWWIGFAPLSYGVSWHKTGYIVAAGLVPRLEWYAAVFTDQGASPGGPKGLSGNAFLLTLSADVQACLEYNFGGSSRNSAACVFAAPALYRDGLFNGVFSGFRLFLL